MIQDVGQHIDPKPETLEPDSSDPKSPRNPETLQS